MSDLYHSRRAGLTVKTSTSVGDYQTPGLLRRRLTPLIPNTKTPILCEDGGPRWSLTGPLSDDSLDRWALRYRPAWGIRTGLLDGLDQWPLVVLDVDDPDAAPDWTLDADLFPWRVKTPRGVHLYSWTGEPLRTRRLQYGDLKAQRAYVVFAQPSGSYTPSPRFGSGQLPLWPDSILKDLVRAESPPDTGQPVSARSGRVLDGYRTRPAAPCGVLRRRRCHCLSDAGTPVYSGVYALRLAETPT